MKTALITGISGQDGAYLSRLLIDKGYKIIGILREDIEESTFGLKYVGVINNIIFEKCSLLDFDKLKKIISKHNPDEVYNLAAQSSVGQSFNNPIETIQFNIMSVLNILEIIKTVNNKIKFYQASSSEMFGRIKQLPIVEDINFNPVSPYATSKASAHFCVSNYREAFGLYATCGILFNHESYLRGENFFVKKVIRDSIKIKKGELTKLNVGNLNVKRDFGYAPKYVKAMWLMLQQTRPDDYIICSGESISLKEIVEYVFKKLDIKLDKLVIDEQLYRPADIEDIYGDNTKAKKQLGWNYNLNFLEVIDMLLEEELHEQNYTN